MADPNNNTNNNNQDGDDDVEEDAGVLLCTRFDGRTQQTSLLVIDAKFMTLLAEANTNTRVPMDFHGFFLPD